MISALVRIFQDLPYLSYSWSWSLLSNRKLKRGMMMDRRWALGWLGGFFLQFFGERNGLEGNSITIICFY